MTLDSALIDRIVSSVLEQIQDGPALAAPVDANDSPASPGIIHPIAGTLTAAKTVEVTPQPRIEARVAPTSPSTPAAGSNATSSEPRASVTEAVVTAAVLENLKLVTGTTLELGARTVLTPSAHDWLRQHRITWTRSVRSAAAKRVAAVADQIAAVGSARWRVLLSTVTPTVRSFIDVLSRSQPGWQRQLVGTAAETVETAVRLLAAAECDRVLAVTSSAELVACRANRNSRVRAAVISTAEHLHRVEADLSPNLIVVTPVERSLMELRHLMQACDKLLLPAVVAE